MKKISILSLSLLTVMAGAAIAPALGVIREYFAGSSPLAIQMIISMPALFIFLTSFIFPRLTERFRVKTLVMMGLSFYVIGGCFAGLFDQIALVLAFRALVGIGVGIIMPLSTGLLSFYYPPEELDGLMGLSSAMNQMGGVIATLL
ncbi:MAG: MFS transporter, partial [Firmicutes bacterium]|nr:MFS transporter [Bacillota bacterium]